MISACTTSEIMTVATVRCLRIVPDAARLGVRVLLISDGEWDALHALEACTANAHGWQEGEA